MALSTAERLIKRCRNAHRLGRLVARGGKGTDDYRRLLARVDLYGAPACVQAAYERGLADGPPAGGAT